MEKDVPVIHTEDTYKMSLREYMKRLRVSHGYSQQYVADYLNVIRQTYSHYENGRINPPINVLYGLAKLYGIHASALFEHTPEGIDERYKDLGVIGTQEDPVITEAGVKQDNEMIRLYEKLTLTQKQSLIEFLRGVVEG